MTSMAAATVVARVAVIAGLLLGAVVVYGPSDASAFCGPPVPIVAPRDVAQERWRYVDPAAGSYQVLHADEDAVTVAMWYPGCLRYFLAFVALDPASGEERWRLTAAELGGLRSDSSAEVDPVGQINDVILVADGWENLIALDAATGVERWRQSMPANVGRLIGVVGETTILTDQSDDGDTDSSDDGQAIIAIDIGTGKIQWRTPMGRISWGGTGSATVGDTVVVLNETISEATSDESRDALIGIDLATGKSRWSFDLATPHSGLEAPRLVAVSDESALVSDDAMLLAVDVSSGVERRRRAGIGPVAGADAGVVVARTVSESSDKADFVALDATTGSERWRSAELDWVLAVVDGLVVGPATGESDAVSLSALDLQTGESRWRLPIGDPVTTEHGVRVMGIVPDGDRLYAEIGPHEPEESGVAVMAIDAHDGELVWSAGYPAYLTMQIRAIADGVVYADAAGFEEAVLLALSAT